MRTCPFCSTENEAFFRFCLGCGADLDEALGTEDDSGESPTVAQASVAAPVQSAPPLVRPEPGASEGNPAGPRSGPAPQRTPDPTASVAGRPRTAGSPETARAAARPYVTSKDTAVDVPAISAETLAALKGEKSRPSRPGSVSSSPGLGVRESAPPLPAERPASTGTGARPGVSPSTPPIRVSRDREKTLDPGGPVKPGSVASQAVAQAQSELRRQSGPTEQIGSNAARGASAKAPVADEEVREEPGVKTKPSPVGTGSSARPSRPTELQQKRVDVAPPPPAKRPTPAQKARLVIILEDGTDGSVLELSPETTVVGREGVDISFPHDDFLAKRHAELTFADGTLYLRPLESTNGVFLQVHQEVELETGDVFRIGQQLLCFEVLSVVAASLAPDPKGQAIPLGSPLPEGAWGRLGQLIAPDTFGSVYLLGGSEVYLGRERGDITFPGDGFVSGLHAQISMRNGRCFLKDLGSSNGTYLRLSKPTPVRRGMLVLAGQQLFRVEA